MPGFLPALYMYMGPRPAAVDYLLAGINFEWLMPSPSFEGHYRGLHLVCNRHHVNKTLSAALSLCLCADLKTVVRTHIMPNIHRILVEQLHKLEDAEFTGVPPRIKSSSGAHYFAKIGQQSEEEQYAGEAESLRQIALAAPGLAPRVLAAGPSEERPYMITEYKELTPLSDAAARRLGKRLATELHQYEGLKGFGFEIPTYCGATRLQNGWFETWESCFNSMIEDLLSQLVKQGGFSPLCAMGELVCKDVIPKLLGPLAIRPVLLHGDLWSGNMGCEASGEPVIFDPASYFGHNEADLAIARIFGGVPKGFFETYHEHLAKTEPVEQYQLRGELYELFHYLNHTLLFGGHYASSAQRKMDILLSAGL